MHWCPTRIAVNFEYSCFRLRSMPKHCQRNVPCHLGCKVLKISTKRNLCFALVARNDGSTCQSLKAPRLGAKQLFVPLRKASWARQGEPIISIKWLWLYPSILSYTFIDRTINITYRRFPHKSHWCGERYSTNIYLLSSPWPEGIDFPTSLEVIEPCLYVHKWIGMRSTPSTHVTPPLCDRLKKYESVYAVVN